MCPQPVLVEEYSLPMFQAVVNKVAQMASQQQTDEEILAGASDEFLDPIMSTLMTDPVILPSLQTTIDRSTISRLAASYSSSTI